jgi:cardiolipin synthase
MDVRTITFTAHFAVVLMVIMRIMLRPHREPASRIAWVAVTAAVPLLGVLAYLLFGEVNIGRRRAERLRRVLAELPASGTVISPEEKQLQAALPPAYASLFRVGESINGAPPVGGNSAQLMSDSNAAIDSMVADIDAALDHVHVLFYIWLSDHNGRKVIAALQRAARRGVVCRAMADGLGSRALIRSRSWEDLREAGVQVSVALPIGNPFLRVISGRIDLRNHRKIVVIDGRITYCGSQNCADPEFLVKAKFAPWVDVVMRFEGPVARQNQRLFIIDWMACVAEDLTSLLRKPMPASTEGFPAQVIGTGPTVRNSAMPEVFESLIFAATRELVISTPYYVPDESLQNALRAAAYRGVQVTIIFPQRNDSWIVAGASRSYYAGLLDAGVKIYEYPAGLLHAKLLTLDGELTLIGSANMDRRSFDLNYENNILFYDAVQTAAIRQRQQEYISRSHAVTREEVAGWSLPRRLWNNTLAMLGPIL